MEYGVNIYTKKKIGDTIVYPLVSFTTLIMCLYLTYSAKVNLAFGIFYSIFFGACFAHGIHLYCKKRTLSLVINKYGINIHPQRSDQTILWENIEGFRMVRKGFKRWIAIDINNTDYWLARDENEIERELSEEMIAEYGSYFAVSSTYLKISHKQLLIALEEGLNRYK